MNIIHERNVHKALWAAAHRIFLEHHSEVHRRDSRNGPVIANNGPLTTEYDRPTERLTFHDCRDINTAFLVYEALWMLQGRNDVRPLTRYVRDFKRYSDDGVSLHGAYGHRWRRLSGIDQLSRIADILLADRDSRQAVLQIWMAPRDLDVISKDIPCNDLATFQIGPNGRLNMVVFCRSNDAVWGTYFANAFHFSVLLEYMAAWVGVPVGTYHQVSVNWHAYEATMGQIRELAEFSSIRCPYEAGDVRPVPLMMEGMTFSDIDKELAIVIHRADMGGYSPTLEVMSPFLRAADAVLQAHHLIRILEKPLGYQSAMEVLKREHQAVDLISSMTAWVIRRYDKWEARQRRP